MITRITFAMRPELGEPLYLELPDRPGTFVLTTPGRSAKNTTPLRFRPVGPWRGYADLMKQPLDTLAVITAWVRGSEAKGLVIDTKNGGELVKLRYAFVTIDLEHIAASARAKL